MKKFLTIILAVFAVTVSYNCRKALPVPDLTRIKLDLPATPYVYNQVITAAGSKAVGYEDFKLIDDHKATIGRVLFYDKALSLNNSVACATCHKQENAFSDVMPFSRGFEEKLTLRNSMPIVNLIDEVNVGYFWDGRETKIESMVFAPVANHIEMGFEHIDRITEKISNLPYYSKLFSDCYGDENVTEQRMRECLGHFLFSLVSYNSKFDRNLLKNFVDFNESEKRGMNLFTKSNCNSCHFISNNFSSSYNSFRYANIGLDNEDKDGGRFGAYKIPRLKNISRTAPYMHDGRFKTLDEVLEHYSHGIKNNPNLTSILKLTSTDPRIFNFSVQDKADLIAFLKTLDDDIMTIDKKFSSPFVKQ